MSCCNSGSFSSEKDTWSKNSSLEMSNWDPYTNLQNPKNCYGSNSNYQPNYTNEGYGGSDPSNYNLLGQNYNNSPSFINNTFSLPGGVNLTNAIKSGLSRENYGGYSNPVSSYTTVQKLSNPQKPYSL